MRITAQSSVFTVHKEPQSEYPFPIEDVDKFIISKDVRRELKHSLNTFGINRLYLFPSLDTAGHHVTWLLTDSHYPV